MLKPKRKSMYLDVFNVPLLANLPVVPSESARLDACILCPGPTGKHNLQAGSSIVTILLHHAGLALLKLFFKLPPYDFRLVMLAC